MSFLIGKKDPNFQNFQRRLKEKALAAVGAIDIVSDQFTQTETIDPLLASVSDATAHLIASKDKITAHVAVMRSLQQSCGELSVLCLYLPPTLIPLQKDPGESEQQYQTRKAAANKTSICPELRAFSDPEIDKSVSHVIADTSINLINQCLELAAIIEEKGKRRTNMVIDYSHHRRLYEKVSVAEKQDLPEIDKRKHKMEAAIVSMQEINTNILQLLTDFTGTVWPQVHDYCRAGLVAAHRFYADQLTGCVGALASTAEASSRQRGLGNKLHNEISGMHEGVGVGGKTRTVFKNKYTTLKELIIAVAKAGGEAYASDLLQTGFDKPEITSNSTNSATGFGNDLNAMCQGNTLPPIFVESIKYLDEKGMEEVGLFRVAGDQGEIQELEAAFKQTASGEGVMESNSAILTVPNMASLLKLWLRNLTTSLIPEASYEAMMQYANSPADFSEKVRNEIEGWPRSHYLTLKHLVCFLGKVAKESEVNKMTSSNLAVVFSPTILKAPESMDPMTVMQNVQVSIKVVSLIIDNVRVIWSEDEVSEAFASLGIHDPEKPMRANKMAYGGASKKQSKPAVPPPVPGSKPPPVPGARPAVPPPVPGSKPPPVPGSKPPPMP